MSKMLPHNSPAYKMMDKFDDYNFNVITYTHIRVPNGWVTEISISKNTDLPSISTLGYDRGLNESVDRAALQMVGKLDGICTPYYGETNFPSRNKKKCANIFGKKMRRV